MADHIITLTAEQEAALAVATSRYNEANGVELAASDYLTLKAGEQLATLLRVHKERILNLLTEKFGQMTPAEQAALLTQLGIALPR